jgi:hypothetical protein
VDWHPQHGLQAIVSGFQQLKTAWLVLATNHFPVTSARGLRHPINYMAEYRM